MKKLIKKESTHHINVRTQVQSPAWCSMPVIPALGKEGQEGPCYPPSLPKQASSGPVRDLSKNNMERS